VFVVLKSEEEFYDKVGFTTFENVFFVADVDGLIFAQDFRFFKFFDCI